MEQCGNRRSAEEVVQSKWWHHKYEGSNLTHISASLLPPSVLSITMDALTHPLKMSLFTPQLEIWCHYFQMWQTYMTIPHLRSDDLITHTHFLVSVSLWGHSVALMHSPTFNLNYHNLKKNKKQVLFPEQPFISPSSTQQWFTPKICPHKHGKHVSLTLRHLTLCSWVYHSPPSPSSPWAWPRSGRRALRSSWCMGVKGRGLERRSHSGPRIGLFWPALLTQKAQIHPSLPVYGQLPRTWLKSAHHGCFKSRIKI